MIGYAMCGSFCTINKSIAQLKKLVERGYEVQPFMSEILYTTDTRFGRAEDINKTVEEICGRKIIHTIPDAEPFGPSKPLDCLIIAPSLHMVLMANGSIGTESTGIVAGTPCVGIGRDIAGRNRNNHTLKTFEYIFFKKRKLFLTCQVTGKAAIL